MHDIKNLVWFELHETMETAIVREKRIKKWNRQWRINLITEQNEDWRDLAIDLGFDRLPFQTVITAQSGDGPPPSRG